MSTVTLEQARDLLASYLDDRGCHIEAENIRKGIDLESYENELKLVGWLYCHTRLAQTTRAVDVGAGRRVIDELNGYCEASDDSCYGTLATSLVRGYTEQLARALSGENAGPVGKYRLLGPNDVIEPDDEFIDDNAVDWVRAGSASGGHLFIGMQYRLGVLKQARRPLPASPAPDKEG